MQPIDYSHRSAHTHSNSRKQTAVPHGEFQIKGRVFGLLLSTNAAVDAKVCVGEICRGYKPLCHAPGQSQDDERASCKALLPFFWGFMT